MFKKFLIISAALPLFLSVEAKAMELGDETRGACGGAKRSFSDCPEVTEAMAETLKMWKCSIPSSVKTALKACEEMKQRREEAKRSFSSPDEITDWYGEKKQAQEKAKAMQETMRECVKKVAEIHIKQERVLNSIEN